jgi:hypothetical protein
VVVHYSNTSRIPCLCGGRMTTPERRNHMVIVKPTRLNSFGRFHLIIASSYDSKDEFCFSFDLTKKEAIDLLNSLEKGIKLFPKEEETQ